MKDNKPSMGLFDNRSEVGYTLPADQSLLLENIKGYQIEKFDNPYVTTIYFGGSSKSWRGNKLLSHAAIKVRFYSRGPKEELFMIPQNQKCILEVKTRPLDNETSRNRKKMRMGTKNGDSTLTYQEIVTFLSDLNKLKKLAKSGNNKVAKLLYSLVNQYKLKRVVPLAASHYKRIHYLGKGERITYDRDIKYYLALRHEGNIVFSKVKTLNYHIIEIKRDVNDKHKESNFKKCLESRSLKIEPLEGENTKGATLFRLINKKLFPEFIEPELDLRSEIDWNITERELKINTSKSPKNFLKSFKIKKGIFVGKSKSPVTYQQVYLVGESGIFVMQKSLKPSAQKIIKYKKFISDDNNILVREEIVFPYTRAGLVKLIKEMTPKKISEVEKSPVFKRDRITRTFYFAKSRNVFEIHADGVKTLKNSQLPLYQVEVEFSGIIDNKGGKKKSDKINFKQINKDFDQLSTLVFKALKTSGLRPEFSTQTKYEWIKQEMSRQKSNEVPN